MMRARTAATIGLMTLAGAAALSGPSGCASYETYPDIPDKFSMADPNTTMMPPVMASAIRWVAMKYPPGGQTPESIAMGEARPKPFAISLPHSANWKTADRVAGEVGMGARPLTADATELPILHVTYVRIRGDEAMVNIIRPVSSLGAAPGGEPIPQEIKLQLRGGLNPWHVVAWREWQVGSGDVPELHLVSRPPEDVPLASRERNKAFVPNPPVNTKIGEPATVRAPE